MECAKKNEYCPYYYTDEKCQDRIDLLKRDGTITESDYNSVNTCIAYNQIRSLTIAIFILVIFFVTIVVYALTVRSATNKFNQRKVMKPGLIGFERPYVAVFGLFVIIGYIIRNIVIAALYEENEFSIAVAIVTVDTVKYMMLYIFVLSLVYDPQPFTLFYNGVTNGIQTIKTNDIINNMNNYRTMY